MKAKTFFWIVIVCAAILAGIIFRSKVFSSTFSTSTSGLNDAADSQIVELKNGDTYDLTMSTVKREINGKEIRMLGYNGMIPGPTVKVEKDAEITINLTNNIDVATTLHSHGVRLDNAYDGLPDVTQKEIKPGETFSYKIKFPDAGVFWYHPHIREDYTQSLGLYGNYLVTSKDVNYLPPVNREEVVALSDMLIDQNGVVPFEKNVNYALMGRYGNTMLVNGRYDYNLSANVGDVVRFYFTNVANTRPFKISIPEAKMKLVASDQSKYEKESFVDSVILGPSERAVVDAYFPKEGSYQILNENPLRSYVLGTVNVGSTKSIQSFVWQFNTLHTNVDVVKDINTYRPYFNKAPDKKLRLNINMGSGVGGGMGMHRMPDGTMMANSGMMHGTSDGIEWEDTMPAMNKAMDASTEWQIIDEDTGKKNMDIDWTFNKGDKVKIEIYNDQSSMHPMQHPIHFHGQRFLVLSRDGVPETNLAWKDTVLVPAGQKVQILLDASNLGTWMAHCHIAEHLEAGMMFMFEVK